MGTVGKGRIMKAKDKINIGSDEAGKGEWLGPLTIAAVALSPEQNTYLISQGVKDSKKLKIDEIIRLARIIKKNCLAYYIVVITPKNFNKAFKIIKNENKTINLNHILAQGHVKAISAVYKKLLTKDVRPNHIKVIIDEFDKVKVNERIKKSPALSLLDIEQKPKAEEEVAVAAASILARAAREHWIDRASKHLNVNLKELTVLDALNNENVELFAKISFINIKGINKK